ncbi:MAG: hypothetical protein KGL02_03390 [Acidobacteriota bacterium]|nr:hypothetical protein [Acidobacteriota bacterium]MDE3170752.1 hypothetical protein [Acidobacteriota bacterium]
MRKSTLGQWLVVAALVAFCGCSHSNAPSNAANSANPADNSAQNAPAAASTPAAAPTPARPPALAPIVVEAGSVITVSLDQSISTKDNSSGDQFEASLAEPITVDGRTIATTGARATGTIVTSQSAGRVKGGAVLALTLDGITIHGRKYAIETSEFEEAGKGRGKRTVVGGGGGAALGAIVGALAGGGKGAAIGALAGGGAGTAGAAFTGKRDITLPAETRLHFKLTRRLTIRD